jgi:hypothetical protein
MILVTRNNKEQQKATDMNLQEATNLFGCAAGHHRSREHFFNRLLACINYPEFQAALEKDGFDADDWMKSPDDVHKQLNSGGCATRDYLILHNDAGQDITKLPLPTPTGS